MDQATLWSFGGAWFDSLIPVEPRFELSDRYRSDPARKRTVANPPSAGVGQPLIIIASFVLN